LAKSVNLGEAAELQIRMDAVNVFNHPEPATPEMDINDANFGLMTGANAKSANRRQFQASVRLSF
jgi:hypothetical protein